MTPNYWIADAQGRVLGPVGLDVLKDLLRAGRLGSIAQVSSDGRNWAPIQTVPELVAAMQIPAHDRAAREKQEAARLRSQLDLLRLRPVHEIFNVSRDAPLEAYRQSFFKLSKRFHPDSLPKDVGPELAEACALAFRFLSSVMNRLESAMNAARSETTPLRPPPPAGELPRYDAEQFVGIRSVGDEVEARIRVTPGNVGMFTDHPMMNLRQGAFFLAHERVLRLGTVVTLIFEFSEPPRTINVRGKVAWEDVGRAGFPRGFGVSFITLRAPEKEFIQAYVARVRGSRNAAGGR